MVWLEFDKGIQGARLDFALDWPVAGGRFFTQTSQVPRRGYAVTDDAQAAFWTAFQDRGGVASLGYPRSGRFGWNGRPTQVFQKAVLQWQPGTGAVPANVFDLLHDRGLDPVLRAQYGIPAQLDPAFDAGKPPAQAARDRLALLDASPAVRARYFAAADPLGAYGLPTSAVADLGDVAVLRTQRAAFQAWRVAVPWAAAGDVTLVNAGELAAALGLFPQDALAPA